MSEKMSWKNVCHLSGLAIILLKGERNLKDFNGGSRKRALSGFMVKAISQASVLQTTAERTIRKH